MTRTGQVIAIYPTGTTICCRVLSEDAVSYPVRHAQLKGMALSALKLGMKVNIQMGSGGFAVSPIGRVPSV